MKKNIFFIPLFIYSFQLFSQESVNKERMDYKKIKKSWWGIGLGGNASFENPALTSSYSFVLSHYLKNKHIFTTGPIITQPVWDWFNKDGLSSYKNNPIILGWYASYAYTLGVVPKKTFYIEYTFLYQQNYGNYRHAVFTTWENVLSLGIKWDFLPRVYATISIGAGRLDYHYEQEPYVQIIKFSPNSVTTHLSTAQRDEHSVRMSYLMKISLGYKLSQ